MNSYDITDEDKVCSDDVGVGDIEPSDNDSNDSTVGLYRDYWTWQQRW